MYGQVKATVSVTLEVTISAMRLDGTFEESQKRALDTATNQITRCLASGGNAYPMTMVGARVDKIDASISSVPALAKPIESPELELAPCAT
jgi:hypothetical protein